MALVSVSGHPCFAFSFHSRFERASSECNQSLMLTVQICAICDWTRLPCSLCAHDEDTRSGLISHCMNVGYSVNWSMQNVVKKHFTEVDTDDTQDTSWLVVIKSGK